MASWVTNSYQAREIPRVVAFVKELFEPGKKPLHGCFVELPVRLLYLASGPDASALGLIGTALFALSIATLIGRKINRGVVNGFARVALWLSCVIPVSVLMTTLVWGTTFSAMREGLLLQSTCLSPSLVNLSQFLAGFGAIMIFCGPVFTYTNVTLTAPQDTGASMSFSGVGLLSRFNYKMTLPVPTEQP